MADDEAEIPAPDPEEDARAPRRRRRWPRVLGVLMLALLLVLWLLRKDIADDVISTELEKRGVPATYEVHRVGQGGQVLRNLVIGDPKRPDLTVEEVRVKLDARWGLPGLGRITLVRPRLYGSYRNGKLSFGSLDPILFTGSKEPFRLPDFDVAIEDGRGRLDSDWGPVGLKIDGAGSLRDGFSGTVAATAPRFDLGGCRGEGATAYGKLESADEKPRFAGPVRIASLTCPDSKLRLAGAAMQLDATADPALDGVEGDLSLSSGSLAYGAKKLRGASAKGRFAWRGQALTARYDLAGTGIDTPQAQFASLGLSGMLRSQANFERIESEGEFSGKELRLGGALDGALASVENLGEDTLAADLVGKMRAALRREERGNRLSGAFVLRQDGGATSLMVPQALWRGGSGEALLALSRLQVRADGGAARIAGNFATGGPDLPRISGRAERSPGGGFSARFAMAEYSAGPSRLALPELVLVQSRNGAIGVAGSATMSGALPGGVVRNLAVPIKGDWSPAGGLAVWRSCTPVRFDSFAFDALTLDRRDLTLCPPPGSAILVSNARVTRFATGTPALSLSGSLGGTRMRIVSGPMGFAVPGTLAARSLRIELGDTRYPSRFNVTNLTARIDGDIAGRFAGADVLLDAVPLDVRDATGNWKLAGGRLSIADAAFRLEDRAVDDRFKPVIAEGATLLLDGNRITAQAPLREPNSKREVVRANIVHNLASGTGGADLAFGNLLFDKAMQPDTLTPLALGVIANAEGAVRGTGRIDWNPRTVTSTGSFTTDKLDFAAAFGPVEGLSGTVVFTDLLGLVTAPAQKLKIAAVNPGIEVNDGELVFEMQPGNVLKLEGAYFPYLDGSLVLDPATMTIGTAETRRLTFHVEGFDAAKFIQRMNMANISATGIFDGTLPMVFDENGGRIENGRLVSRAPGGNVSYVGQLTYQDMSFMANFAFDALKSIDYKHMRIDLDGSLQGEMITRVSFEGIRQGKTARRNFITNQIAKLPIQFRVNLRAPFFKLVSSFRSLYDPTYVLDPRTLGLAGADGKPLAPVQNPPQPGVQPPVSGTKP